MKQKNAFTLIEILAVIVILGLLFTILVPNIMDLINTSKQAVNTENMQIFAKDVIKKYSESISNESYTFLTKESGGITFDEKIIFSNDWIRNVVLPSNSKIDCYDSDDLSKVTYDINHDTLSIINCTINGDSYYSYIGENVMRTDEVLSSDTSVYNISYNLGSGILSRLNPYNYTAQSNDITLTNPTKTGYTFIGWTGTDLTSETETVTIEKGSTGDRAYTANYETIDYIISTTVEGVTTQRAYTIESDAFTIVNPTKTGYTFNGWSETPLGEITTNEITIEKGSTVNSSYYAHFTINTYTLTINPNGGSYNSSTNTQTISLDYNETLAISNPFYEGNYFDSWILSGTGSTFTNSVFKMGAGDASLTAYYYSYASMYTYTGTTSPFINDLNGNWRIKFLTSGTFTPFVDMTIDVFLVGGGSSRGGSGYTATYKTIYLTKNTDYVITVGAGGVSGGNGTASTAFGYTANPGVGANGGSGAGESGYTWSGGNGGSDGSNGYSSGSAGEGSGQGSTTREFGEPTGQLYAGGGGGGGGFLSGYSFTGGAGGAGGGGNGQGSSTAGTAGTPNTGGGGGLGIRGDTGPYGGGSGIVIIRNHK